MVGLGENLLITCHLDKQSRRWIVEEKVSFDELWKDFEKFGVN